MARTICWCLIALLGGLLVGPRWINSQPPGIGGGAVWNPPGPTSTGNETMLMQSGLSSTGAHQVILVDTVKRVMVVYTIAPDTGVIQLRSVRNLGADFQLEEFNGSDPSPAKVRGITNPP